MNILLSSLNCGNCGHWQNDNDGYTPATGRCLLAKEGDEFYTCVYGDTHGIDDDFLATTENFGCFKHTTLEGMAGQKIAVVNLDQVQNTFDQLHAIAQETATEIYISEENGECPNSISTLHERLSNTLIQTQWRNHAQYDKQTDTFSDPHQAFLTMLNSQAK